MRFVAVFAASPTLQRFCSAEFLAVANIFGVRITPIAAPWLRGDDEEAVSPFFFFDTDASMMDVEAVAHRCILLRGIYTLLAAAPTLEQVCRRHEAPSDDTKNTLIVGDAVEAELGTSSYSFRVETIGKKYTEERKKEVMAALHHHTTPPAGQIDFRSPQHRFFVFVEHLIEPSPPGAKNWLPNGPLRAVVLCVLAVESHRSSLLARYDLKKRPYIGTTSMPPEESILMSNLAYICNGHVVYDPFCGTGSLLLAAAHCGARTFGSDADARAMRAGTARGKISPQLQQQRRLALANYSEAELSRLTEEEKELPSMWTNFRIYHLPPPDRLRINFSSWASLWRGREGFLDAIVSDPPYGLREPRKREASAAEHGGDASLTSYQTYDVVLDLVLFAATNLVVGGHLSFWHPTTDGYTSDELPHHPSMELIHDHPQRLSLKVVRRLITMRKIAACPSPPPTREACAPRLHAEDLRELMEKTELPENADYTHYRLKIRRKREATAQYWRSHNTAADSASQESAEELPRRRRKQPHERSRVETQELVVANRERNLRERAEKQRVANERNAANQPDARDT